MNNEVAVRGIGSSKMSGFEMHPRSMEEAMRYCEIMSKSDLVPKDYKDKPGNILVACQMGAELGMSPMRSIRSIAVINGRASQWGDDMLAMVLASPVCEYVHEEESTDQMGVCEVKRRGDPKPHRQTFSLQDAKTAGLLGKAGTWQTSPKRMLKLRARGFALRDKFADILAGLITAEEAMDLPKIEPEDPKTNILEASQPLTLKDKLRAKVEAVDENKAELAKRETAQEKADGYDSPKDATAQAERTGDPPSAPLPLSIDETCFRLEGVESPKQFADLMNAALACDYTEEERRRLQDNANVAKKRLGIK